MKEREREREGEKEKSVKEMKWITVFEKIHSVEKRKKEI